MSLAVTLSRIASLVALALLVPVMSAHALPWHRGVDEAAKTRARTAYDEGVNLLRNGFFVRATEAFHRALTDWDHPSVHFLLAKALLNLDASPEALVAFWTAMRHGGKPLELDHIDQIERYTALLLREELGILAVRQANGPVVLDGQVVSKSGRWIGLVRAGERRVGPAKVTVKANHHVEYNGGETSRPLDAALLSEVQRTLVGFEVRYPSKDERASWPSPHPPAPPPSTSATLPPPVDTICAQATGQMAVVCRHYETDRAALSRALHQAEVLAHEAQRRLRELVAGSIEPLESLK